MSPSLTLKGLKLKAMVDKIVELSDRAIPGVTGRQLIALISAVAVASFMYFTIMGRSGKALDKSTENGAAMQVFINQYMADKKDAEKEKRETERIVNARLSLIELNLKALEVRLDITEKK